MWNRSLSCLNTCIYTYIKKERKKERKGAKKEKGIMNECMHTERVIQYGIECTDVQMNSLDLTNFVKVRLTKPCP